MCIRDSYAGKSANGEQLEWAAQAYAELLGQLRPRERARYIRARLLHGLGDLCLLYTSRCV